MKLLCVSASLIACSSVRALTVDGAIPNPPVSSVRVAVGPSIDGQLDDACWKAAPVVSGFTRDTKPPSLGTEVRVLYDKDALYFGFQCHDPESSRIIAQQRKRNGNFDQEDYVAVGIDPRYDRQSAYWFRVNALGTQGEDIPGGAAAKVGWRGDWRAAARVTEDGWTAEVAVPFGILRYPRGQRKFGLMFERRVQRLMEQTNWPIRTFYYVHDNEACLENVEAPHPDGKPVVMPYVLGATGSIRSNAGLDVKYTTDNDVTALATLRPDFATIEDVVQTIDFSYSPRRLSDRRPFFTDGGDYFGSYYAFYSRNIGEVDAGAKAFGKVGPWRFATMAAGRRSQGTSAVARVGWEPDTTHSAGIGVFSRMGEPVLDDDGHRTGSLDNNVVHATAHYWKPLAVNGIDLSTNFYRSFTSGPGGEGHVWDLNYNRFGGDGVREYYVGYAEVSPQYTAELAYLPERGFRNVIVNTYEQWQVKSGALRQIWQYANVGRETYWDGGVWHQGIDVYGGASFRNDTALSLGMTGYDRHRGTTSAEAAGDLYFHDRIVDPKLSWRTSDIYRAGYLNLRFGRQAGGPYTYLDISQGFRFSERVSGSVNASLIRIKGTVDDVNIHRVVLSGLYEFSPERSIALRFIAGTDRSAYRDQPAEAWDPSHRNLTNAYIAYRQELRKGADIFVLAGDPNPATEGIHSQIAIKLVETY